MSIANKVAAFGLAVTAMASGASAQRPIGEKIAPTPTPGDTLAPAVKKVKQATQCNGFTVMNVGAIYSQNALFSSGVQFDAHANISAGDACSLGNKYAQIKAGFNLRDEGIRFENKFEFPGGNASNVYIYKPSEAYIDLQVGPKFRFGREKPGDRSSKLVVMPYASVGASNGWGSNYNFLNTFSPRAAVGVNFLFGNISREGVDPAGNPIQLGGPTTALSGFIEFGKQKYNQNGIDFFRRNQVDPNAPTVRAGIALGIAW